MAEHHTRNTVEVRKFCKPCGGFTMHRVLGGREAGCIECEKKPVKVTEKKPPARQTTLFGD